MAYHRVRDGDVEVNDGSDGHDCPHGGLRGGVLFLTVKTIEYIS